MAERWDRDRFMSERSSREQLPRDDDIPYMRGGRGRAPSEDNRRDRRFNRSYDDDDMVRDRRYYDDEPRFVPRRERDRSPPEFARRVVLEKERERDYYPRRDSPPRRPGFLRRQSSLDTFDRPPILHRREEYPPPARREDIRREDFRAPPYVPIPLPKTRGLPPPRRFREREFYEDIDVAEPDFYGDDDFRPYPERVREREFIRDSRRRRDRRGRSRSRESRSTRTHSHRSSSSGSSVSSSSSGGTTVKSEYPKKGKTRIPAKLVSTKAIIDLGYPFVREGNTIIIQKALGQDNIDELLQLSEEHKLAAQEYAALEGKPPMAALPAPPQQSKPAPSKSPETSAPTQAPPPPAPPVQAPPQQSAPPHAPPPMAAPQPRPAPPPQMMPPPPPANIPRTPGPPAPVVITAGPPRVTEDVYEDTYIRDVSPDRSSVSSSSWDSRSYHHHGHRRERSAPVPVGPLALVERSRSRSRSGREIRAEIKALERELAHRPKGGSNERDIVRAERLPDGQLVIYEENVEKIVEHPKPPRIEKDKKGPPPALMRAMLATLT